MAEMKATNVKGKVTATNAKCEVRQINEGDAVQPGEVVKTADGAVVQLQADDCTVKNIDGKETVKLDAEVLATVDATESAVNATEGEISSIIDAIGSGNSLDSLLQETAAGLTSSNDAGSAKSDGGSNFVDLSSAVDTAAAEAAIAKAEA